MKLIRLFFGLILMLISTSVIAALPSGVREVNCHQANSALSVKFFESSLQADYNGKTHSGSCAATNKPYGGRGFRTILMCNVPDLGLSLDLVYFGNGIPMDEVFSANGKSTRNSAAPGVALICTTAEY